MTDIREQIEAIRSIGGTDMREQYFENVADTMGKMLAVVDAAKTARIELGFSSSFVAQDLCDAIDALEKP